MIKQYGHTLSQDFWHSAKLECPLQGRQKGGSLGDGWGAQINGEKGVLADPLICQEMAGPANVKLLMGEFFKSVAAV
jgi:hypothetical protein